MTKDNHKLGEFQLSGIPPMPRGVPQIEITYDIDANGILNVSAVEKSSGRENKITIENNSSNLSSEDVERMVQEAEKFKEEDERNASRIQAKNDLENSCYSFKNTLNDEKMKEKFSEEDKTMVLEKVDACIQWLDDNQECDKETYEAKSKELNDAVQPIMMKAYQSGMQEGAGMPGTGMPGGGMPGSGMGGMPGGSMSEDNEPKIEEVD